MCPIAALRRPATPMAECGGGSGCGAYRLPGHGVPAAGSDRNPRSDHAIRRASRRRLTFDPGTARRHRRTGWTKRAGKTTTLRMLLGLIRPTDGSASVLGESIRHPRAFMHSVGALIEGPAFYPTLSGRTNLSTLGRHRDADISGLLQTVGLADRARHKVSSYSLGMKQRLGIAAALLGEHGRVRRLRRHRNIVDASAHRGMSGLVRPDPRLNAERQPARPAPNLHSRTVILVDGGVATGATIRAAIAVVRA